jgi:hypothetical protein
MASPMDKKHPLITAGISWGFSRACVIQALAQLVTRVGGTSVASLTPAVHQVSQDPWLNDVACALPRLQPFEPV